MEETIDIKSVSLSELTSLAEIGETLRDYYKKNAESLAKSTNMRGHLAKDIDIQDMNEYQELTRKYSKAASFYTAVIREMENRIEKYDI